MLLTKLHPLYDIEKTYLENLREGPFFEGDIAKRHVLPEDKWIDFLGFRIASPLGIPAGPLLASNWISLSAKLGFDVLTYKTIRRTAFSSHPLPNMIYVKTEKEIFKDHPEKPAIRIFEPPSNIEELAVTNSFGNPSMSPEFLIEDIAQAKASLSRGQVLIVSIYGYPHDDIDALEDFVLAASFAKEAGAPIIEANFSCPNVNASEGCLYTDPELVYRLTKRIVAAIHPIPLIIKVGLFPNKHLMRKVMIELARGGALGLCGINTIKMHVIDDKGNPALGKERLSAGICGSPIRAAALEFTQEAKMVIDQEKLDLTLLSTGGVTLPQHFDDLFSKGALIAMSGSGMMWDPYLALKWHGAL